MSTPTTRITLFGALEIVHPPAAPLRPPTQRVLALLGYVVAHHGVAQRRDKLVDLLWPELPPRQGRRMLSDALWRARRLLTPPGQAETPALVIAGDTVTFRPDAGTWVDLIDFEQHLHRAEATSGGEIEQLRAAVELYRGDFLEDCYDEWALYERERLREQYLSALLRLLAHDQARQAYDQALLSALRLVRADPLREEAHRALMRLYHLLGRTEEALRSFEQCRAVLEAELGVEPEAETLSLYEELAALQQRRAEAPSQSAGAPAASVVRVAISNDPPFVGRQVARAEVMEAVERALAGAGGLALVTGAAGMGKSRLLREAGAGAAWRGAQVSWGHGREDAQALPFGALREALLAALTPLRARQVAAILPAHTLGALLPLLPSLTEMLPDEPLLAPQPGEHQIAGLYAAIAGVLHALGQIAPQVLMLEDLHWFDPATLDALVALAPALSSARVLLLLSARPDDLARRQSAWTTLLRLDRAGLLRRLELHGLSEQDCAELVRRALRMRQAAPRFSARVAAATGGNPFFMLETLRALHEQGTLVRDAQGVWHTPWDRPESDYHELPLPEGLRQLIDGRVRELGQEERAALAAASVLGQSFSPVLLARMTYDKRQTTNDPLPALGSGERSTTIGDSDGAALVGGRWPLVTDQLLRRQFLAEDGAGYRFEHELLREVIYDRLDPATRQTLHLRAAEALEQEHYARAEALAQHLYLAQAWDKAAPYLIQAGDRARAVCAYRDALRNYDQAIESTERQGPEPAHVAMLWDTQLKRGAVATALGEYAIATAAYEEVMRLAEHDESMPDAASRSGARDGAQIQALNGLGYVYGLRNEYVQAQDAIRQAMARAEQSPRLIDRAEVLYQAGMISFRRDDYAEARRFLSEAVQLYEMLGLDTERAKCLSRIGTSYLRQNGSTDQVIEYLTQALDIYRRQGDRFAEHSCLGDIGSAYLVGGRLSEVIQAVEPCLAFFRSIGTLDDISACLFLRGEAYRRMGQLDEAIEALRESWSICKRLDRNAAAVFNEVCMAATLRDMGRYEEALAMLDQPLHTDDRLTKTRALLVVTDIRRIQGHIAGAWAQLEEALALARWLGSKAYLGIAHRLLAQLRGADTHGRLAPPTDDAPDAETSFAISMRLLEEAHSDDELALSCIAYGQYLAPRRPSEARAALIQAQQLASRCRMDAALTQIQPLLQSLPTTPAALHAGQRRVLLARHGVPRGRPLRADELVEVIWTIEEPGQREVGREPDKATARQERLLRLCAEASAQGAEPTVADLAAALGVTPRTVDRDIAALRAAGATLATRGGSGSL